MAASANGFTAYRLSLDLSGGAVNVFTIYGHEDAPMSLPAANQVAPPFGANIGGINAALINTQASAALDSWLTVGLTTGNEGGQLSHAGIAFEEWTADNPLVVNNGAVFWMNPDNAPSAHDDGRIVVAQITVPTGTGFIATINAEGRGVNRELVNGACMLDLDPVSSLACHHVCACPAPSCQSMRFLASPVRSALRICIR